MQSIYGGAVAGFMISVNSRATRWLFPLSLLIQNARRKLAQNAIARAFDRAGKSAVQREALDNSNLKK